MATTLTVNGVSYSFPQTGDEQWGDNVTNWATAVTSGMLQKAGGTFTLTAEVDFGASFGLKAVSYKSRASNPAGTGIVRLGNAESISWRNAANSADLALKVNASNLLEFAGTALQNVLSVSDTSTIDLTLASDVLSAAIIAGSITNSHVNASAAIAYSKLDLAGGIVNADINASAAIAYSKLSLTGSIVNADISASAAIAYSKLSLTGEIVNADISASAAIAYSKLSLTGSIVNADVSASAAIAYSKLNLAASIVNADIAVGAAIAYSKLSLTGSILNADINASAAIAVSKLAAVTASRVLVSDGSGFMSASSVTSTTLGYLDATSSVQTQLDAKIAKSVATTKGDILVATASATIARLGVGSNGQALVADSTTTEGIKWGTPVGATLGTVSAKSADYTVLDNDGFYLIEMTTGASDRTVTLPTAANNTNRILMIKKVDSGAGKCTVSGTIDGGNFVLYSQNDSVTIVCNGTNWRVLSKYLAVKYLSATATTATPGGTGQYPTITGNSITLTPGRWMLSGHVVFDSSGGSPAYTFARVLWGTANGANSTSAPTGLTTNQVAPPAEGTYGSSMYLNSTDGGFTIQAPTVVVEITSSLTVYLNAAASLTTASRARITPYLGAYRID